jgi:hypothetical protein
MLFSGIAIGQEADKPPQQQEIKKDEIQISEEKRYVVKEGDTLWDISSSLMKDPFLWPRLWKDNKYIINPDLIYPGNVIILPGEEAAVKEAAPVAPQPPSAPPKEAAPAEEKAAEEVPAPIVEEAAPAVEEEVAKEAPPKEKRKALIIGGIETLKEDVLIFSSGFIAQRVENKGVIIGSWDKKEMLGDNDIIYIDRKKNPSIAKDEKYTIYRIAKKVEHPATGKKMGYLVKILGVVQITSSLKKDVVTGTIIRSFDAMKNGDKLMPYKKVDESMESGSKGVAGKKLKGYVVEVKDEKIENADLDIVYIDKGENDGVMRGDRFWVVRRGEKTSMFSPGGGIRLPSEAIAELKVISVEKSTATAQIIKSLRSIIRGDVITSKQ